MDLKCSNEDQSNFRNTQNVDNNPFFLNIQKNKYEYFAENCVNKKWQIKTENNLLRFVFVSKANKYIVPYCV